MAPDPLAYDLVAIARSVPSRLYARNDCAAPLMTFAVSGPFELWSKP